MFEMKNVLPANEQNLRKTVKKRLPVSVFNFLDIFLRKLGNILGASFYVDANHAKHVRAAVGILHKLDYLQATGVVERHYKVGREYFDEPPIFGVQVSLVGDKRIGYSGYGRSYSSYEEAYGPAYGEALERWCIENFSPSFVKRLSASELKGVGLDLNNLPGPNRTMLPFKQGRTYAIDDNSLFLCTVTKDLARKSHKIYAPLQWFSFKHCRDFVLTGKEPQIQPMVTTGAAAGVTYERAVLGAIHESLERDAFMLYWLKQITPERIDISQFDSDILSRIQSWKERYQLEAHFLYLPTDFFVHNVLCVIVDRTGIGPAVVVDACTNDNFIYCLEKSFICAVKQRSFMRRKWKALEGKEVKSHALEIELRPFWWYKTNRLPLLEFLLSGPTRTSFPSYQTADITESFSNIINEFSSKNYMVLCATTLPKIHQKRLGDFVVGVKIPQLIPMHLNEWEKTVTGSRLKAVPSVLGLKVGTSGVNNVPHPFS